MTEKKIEKNIKEIVKEVYSSIPTLPKTDQSSSNYVENNIKNNNSPKLTPWELFDKVKNSNSIHRLLLHGQAGTSKSTSACLISPNKHYSITLHEESCVAELIGHWIKKGEGYEFHYGVGSLAFRDGWLLVINEIDKASSSVLTILHALLDDKSIAHITLPTNETIKVHPDFRVVATMNDTPDILPPPLLDRFDVVLHIKSPHPEAIKSLSTNLQQIAINSYQTDNVSLSFRQIVAFDKLRTLYGEDIAAQLVFADKAVEILNVIKLGTRE